MPKLINKMFGRKPSLYDCVEPYVVNLDSTGSFAEVNLYGEVVQEHPVDWWTGEKVEGLFIALDDFISDLDRLSGLSEVRFNINSPGGAVDAGVVIFNKMRDLSKNGTHIVTRVEGVAASAASVIFQGGDDREMCIGSQVMIHNALCLLWGYYNSKDLDEIKAMLDSTNARINEIYVDTTGKDKSEITRMMNKTTWMTSQEAVDLGFADSVVNKKIEVKETKGLFNTLLVNGIPQSFRGLPMPYQAGTQNMGEKASETEVSEPILITDSAGTQPIEDTQNPIKEEKQMTLEELKAQSPEIVDELKAEILAELEADKASDIKAAVEAERQRISDIEKIAPSIADKAMVEDAKYTHIVDAKTLAFNAMQMQAQAGENFLSDMLKDANDSGVLNVSTTPADTNDTSKIDDVMSGAAMIAGFPKKEDK